MFPYPSDVAAFATAAGGQDMPTPAHPLSIDLPAEGIQVIGGSAGTVSAAGDVNGDGRPDIFLTDPYSPSDETQVYAIFGPLGSPAVDPSAVDGAGDVNGDGLGDVVLSPSTECAEPSIAFVVFGKPDTEPVALADLDGRRFRIEGSDEPTGGGSCVGGNGMSVSGDRLRGYLGDDRLTGGPGRDLLLGNAGSDWIYAVDGVHEVIRCGAGRDYVRADLKDRVVGCERVRRIRFIRRRR